MITRTTLFFIAMFLQVGLLVAIPLAPRADESSREGGEVIRLAVEPGTSRRDTGDIYEPNYLIAKPGTIDDWQLLPSKTPVCAVLVPGDDGFHRVDSIHTRWPRRVPPGGVILRGMTTGYAIAYDGLYGYYSPRLSELRPGGEQEIVVEFRVFRNGSGRIEGIWVDGRRY